jgi:hypothetical protein
MDFISCVLRFCPGGSRPRAVAAKALSVTFVYQERERLCGKICWVFPEHLHTYSLSEHSAALRKR